MGGNEEKYGGTGVKGLTETVTEWWREYIGDQVEASGAAMAIAAAALRAPAACMSWPDFPLEFARFFPLEKSSPIRKYSCRFGYTT